MIITHFGTISYNEESDELKIDGFAFDAEGGEPFSSANDQGEAMLLCITDFLKSKISNGFKYNNLNKE
ncbi:MAG: hypothetical protein V3V81_07315 [Candidatus Bathyarchaeia archaeon]